LERHFKPIINLLKQIVENTVNSFKDPIMIEISFREKMRNQKKTTKCFIRQSYTSFYACEISVESIENYIILSTLNEVSKIIQPRDLLCDHVPSVEEIFEIADEPLVTSIRHLLQTPEEDRKSYIKLVHWDKNI